MPSAVKNSRSIECGIRPPTNQPPAHQPQARVRRAERQRGRQRVLGRARRVAAVAAARVAVVARLEVVHHAVAAGAGVQADDALGVKVQYKDGRGRHIGGGAVAGVDPLQRHGRHRPVVERAPRRRPELNVRVVDRPCDR